MHSTQASQNLTRPQAADYLGLKKSTLDAWACQGKGPVYRKYGRAVRYLKQDLDSFIEQSRRESTATGDSPSHAS